MKRICLLSAVFASLVMVLSCARSNPTLSLEGGKIRGVLTDSSNVLVYKGIPYAAPPVGELRLKAPQGVIPWKGVRECSSFSAIAPQPGSPRGTFYGEEFYWMPQPVQSEDCLYLNVWAPAGAVGKRGASLPVAMWIHGGAFVNGYGFEVSMDGDIWARKGVILVTINYRLGENAAGNLNILDQIAALGWIRDNISRFGGDPSNVTIFGQSAGGMSVRTLLASPLARGLFSKAIIQSGGGMGVDRLGMTLPWAPAVDGKVVPKPFDEAVLDGTMADVPVMIGYTADDIPFFKEESVGRFCAVRDSLGTAPVYEYEFSRDLPGEDKDVDDLLTGAFHSSELWYVFGTLGRSWRPFTEEDYALSEEMVTAWTDFCKTGSPGWPACTRENPYKKVF